MREPAVLRVLIDVSPGVRDMSACLEQEAAGPLLHGACVAGGYNHQHLPLSAAATFRRDR